MNRLCISLIALAILVSLAPLAAAQPREREPVTLDALRLGQQLTGTRVTHDDLEGRVVLTYQWCVS